MFESKEATDLAAGQQDREAHVFFRRPHLLARPRLEVQERDRLVPCALEGGTPDRLGLIRAPEAQVRGGAVHEQRLVGERPSRSEAAPLFAVAGRLYDPPDMSFVHRSVPSRSRYGDRTETHSRRPK